MYEDYLYGRDIKEYKVNDKNGGKKITQRVDYLDPVLIPCLNTHELSLLIVRVIQKFEQNGNRA